MVYEKYNFRIPFPRIPDSVEEKYPVGDLSLRPFGLRENDLVVDFHQRFRPYIVTEILQYCTSGENGETPEQAFFWDLTIGKRIECLLTIGTSGGSSELFLQLRCKSETCRQTMEISISLEELAHLQHQSDTTDIITIQIEGKELRFRKPTGRDQLNWLTSSFPTEDTAIRAMIRTLCCDSEEIGSDLYSPHSDEWVEAIDKAMDEYDPLVNFSLTVHCPYCDKKNVYAVDLDEILLRELHTSQSNLLHTIHRLAVHYHWSEQQILSISPWRRARYLDLIEKEGFR